jgi:hypothetical protein
VPAALAFLAGLRLCGLKQPDSLNR